MLIRKIAVENVRSFLERQEMAFEGPISIIVGPNGGGKTNLLDTIVTMLRRYLIATRYPIEFNSGTENAFWQLQQNNMLNQLILEKHSHAPEKPQIVEVTIEVSGTDLDNMTRIKNDADELWKNQTLKYNSNPWKETSKWDIDAIKTGSHITFVWENGILAENEQKSASDFLEYLRLFEFDNSQRSELKKEPLQLPMIYLPVSRTSTAFQSRVSLSGFNDLEEKQRLDTITSRSGGTNIVQLAIGRLGKRYRRLELDDNTSVKTAFYADDKLKALTAALADLGYSWKLETINPDTNEYDVMLTKQGTEFTSGAASSGERELLTYLFAIYALNVRDAVIVVDEPELHLHPRWQKILFTLFDRMSRETGNQFVLATHSPTFISPASIQYVSRVYIEDQKSRIVRLNATDLPNAKHLFNIVNSQNNERLFFCDRVILVEGLSDRMFFEKVLERLGQDEHRDVIEIVSVGGKGLFESYKKLLKACHVPSTTIADLDYIEQVGTGEIKRLFRINVGEIKKDVIENVSSLDGATLVARIEEAMISGDWADAVSVWEYIKSRRRMLKPDLSQDEEAALNSSLLSLREDGINILSRGALEDYLPAGHRGKDLEKLIAFLEQPDFWDQLPRPQRDEIENLVKSILRGEEEAQVQIGASPEVTVPA
ncbi:AAA family ATPase [Gluconobacter potus]|uniref:AAA family ATPase n=1 Tax=Gluconobacter potus TaxID=2724927 RepID=UPI0039ED56A0